MPMSIIKKSNSSTMKYEVNTIMKFVRINYSTFIYCKSYKAFFVTKRVNMQESYWRKIITGRVKRWLKLEIFSSTAFMYVSAQKFINMLLLLFWARITLGGYHTCSCTGMSPKLRKDPSKFHWIETLNNIYG